MSTWEERMSAQHRAKMAVDVEAKRRAYLGEMFLPYWPEDIGIEYGFEPQTEVLPGIIAANCLGITYGDPGPRLPDDHCRDCYGERYIWLGNAWGLQHVRPLRHPDPGRLLGCGHSCHDGEVWLASAG